MPPAIGSYPRLCEPTTVVPTPAERNHDVRSQHSPHTRCVGAKFLLNKHSGHVFTVQNAQHGRNVYMVGLPTYTLQGSKHLEGAPAESTCVRG